jgi:hypothetical protein
MALRVEADGVEGEVTVPEGVGLGDVFAAEVAAPPVPTVVATAVPSDEEMAAALQREECDRAIAALDAVRLVAPPRDAYGLGHAHLSLTEQKLINYKWSIKCFALVDVLDTFLTCLGPVGAWGPAALVFLLGPLCGYLGARQLDRSKVAIYVGFSCIKSIYVRATRVRRASVAG